MMEVMLQTLLLGLNYFKRRFMKQKDVIVQVPTLVITSKGGEK